MANDNNLSLVQHERRILFQSVRKHWRLIALGTAFSILTALFEGLSIGMLVPFLQSFGEASAKAFRTGWEWVDVYLLGSNQPSLQRMYRISVLILIGTWLRSVFSYLASIYGAESQWLVVEDMRMRVVDQLKSVSLSFFSKVRTGEILNTLTNEMARVGQALQMVNDCIKHSAILLAYLIIMICISWQLTILTILFFSLVSLGLTRLISLIRSSGKNITLAGGQLTSLASEFIGGIRTVQAFNMQPYERQRLSDATRRLSLAGIETSRRSSLVLPISQATIGTLLILTVLLATKFYVVPGKLDLALLLAFMFAMIRLKPTVHELNRQRGQWASVRAAASNVADLLRCDDKPYLADGSRRVDSFGGALVFENVSFAYDPGIPILKDIHLQITCGQTTAIIGASGAGKSTLVDLIPRFYDPTQGRILLDGVDLREFSLSSLRSKIAIVSQDTFIFNDTVRANIAYGAPEITLDRIINAAEKSNAMEFIRDMPEGFDTVLGDRGVRLSGGQRQRLAIARALLRDPEILILDEATSALDSVSERLVQQSLEDLMKGRTVIAIAHRLSTIENADVVVVLENGSIVEQGTYVELLSRKGQLWMYHSIQFEAA